MYDTRNIGSEVYLELICVIGGEFPRVGDTYLWKGEMIERDNPERDDLAVLYDPETGESFRDQPNNFSVNGSDYGREWIVLGDYLLDLINENQQLQASLMDLPKLQLDLVEMAQANQLLRRRVAELDSRFGR